MSQLRHELKRGRLLSSNSTLASFESFLTNLPNDSNLWLYVCLLAVVFLFLVMCVTCLCSWRKGRKRKVQTAKNTSTRQSAVTTTSLSTHVSRPLGDVQDVDSWIQRGEQEHIVRLSGTPISRASLRRSAERVVDSSNQDNSSGIGRTEPSEPVSARPASEQQNRRSRPTSTASVQETLTTGPVVIVDPVVHGIINTAVSSVEDTRGTDGEQTQTKLDSLWSKVMREKVLTWQGVSTPYEHDEEGLSQQSSWLGHDRAQVSSTVAHLRDDRSHPLDPISKTSSPAEQSATHIHINSHSPAGPDTLSLTHQSPKQTIGSRNSREVPEEQGTRSRLSEKPRHRDGPLSPPQDTSRLLDFMAEGGDVGVLDVPVAARRVSFVGARESGSRKVRARLSLGRNRRSRRFPDTPSLAVSDNPPRSEIPSGRSSVYSDNPRGPNSVCSEDASRPSNENPTRPSSMYSDASSRVTGDGTDSLSSSSSSAGSSSVSSEIARAVARETRLAQEAARARQRPSSVRSVVSSLSSLSSQGSVRHYRDGDESHLGGFAPEPSRPHRRSTLVTDAQGNSILQMEHRDRIRSIPLTADLFDSSSSESDEEDPPLSARALAQARRRPLPSRSDRRLSQRISGRSSRPRSQRSSASAQPVQRSRRSDVDASRPLSASKGHDLGDFPSVASMFELDLMEARDVAKHDQAAQGQRKSGRDRASLDVDALDYYFRSSGSYRARLSLSDPPKSRGAARRIGRRARQRAESSASYLEEGEQGTADQSR